jgi:type IV fimbrial biogenesis protein FimT
MASTIARHVQAGFSLVELITVLAVISIVIAVGMPQFAEQLANAKVRSAAESVQSGMRMAQVEAMKRSNATEWALVSVDPVPANVAGASASSGRNWMARVRTDAVRGINAPVFLAGSEANNAQAAQLTNQSGTTPIVFMPTGQVMQGDPTGPVALAAPMVVRVTSAGSNRPLCVFASPAGSIKVCDPALGTGDPRACRPAITTAACPAA